MYKWSIWIGKTLVEGESSTLQDAIDRMVSRADGETIRDFHINGHNMNEEFDLIIADGAVWHSETDEEFVPMNKWYGVLAIKSEMDARSAAASADRACDEMESAMSQFNRIFRPQPTRGMSPQNPETLEAKGEDL